MNTFNRLAVILGVCTMALALSFARAVSAPDSQKEIRAVLAKQAVAWNRGDISGFLTGYWHSEALTFASSAGVSRGYDQVLSRYKQRYPDKNAMGQLTFSDLEVSLLGADSAFVIGKWHLDRSADDLGGVFTLVFRRFPDGWKIVHDHTSQDLASK